MNLGGNWKQNVKNWESNEESLTGGIHPVDFVMHVDASKKI